MECGSDELTRVTRLDGLVTAQHLGDHSVIAPMILSSDWTLPRNSAEFVTAVRVVQRGSKCFRNPVRGVLCKNLSARKYELRSTDRGALTP